MAVKYDLMVANGTYEKDGQQKTSWLKIGRVMEKQNGGMVMKLDSIPVSTTNRDGQTISFDGWVQMFDVKPKQQQAPQGGGNNFDDDIPFAPITSLYGE